MVVFNTEDRNKCCTKQYCHDCLPTPLVTDILNTMIKADEADEAIAEQIIAKLEI